MKLKFKRLRYRMISIGTARKINSLLHQLSERAQDKTIPDFKRILAKRDAFVIGAFINNVLIGMAGIYFRETILIGKKGTIEDVIVDKNERGKGIGRRLVDCLLKEAKKRGINYIELTSNPNNPKRKEAILMYESMGFKKRDTNCYHLYLIP